MAPNREFRQAVIPAELAKEIVAIIQAHPELGHRTLSDFIRCAAQDRIQRVHVQVAMRALSETCALGAEAITQLLRDSLPADYAALLSDPRNPLQEGRRRLS